MARREQPKFRIKADDTVFVTTGKDKGRTGRVLKVIPDKGKIIVEGMREVKKHQKAMGEEPGAIITKEMPMDISNVALWNEEEGRCVKVAYKTLDDGKKVRIDRKTGAVLSQD